MSRFRTTAARSTLAIIFAAASIAACSDAGTAPRTAVAAPEVSASLTDGAFNTASGSLAYTDHVSLTVPSQFAIQDRCAGGRFGEIIVFQGDQHLTFTETSTANGHLSTKLQWNAEGITGIGQYTGFTYRATGVTQDHTVSGAPLPYSETMINNNHIIGQGQATNMDLHETVHITVNANGDVTAYVTDYNFDCKGTPTF